MYLPSHATARPTDLEILYFPFSSKGQGIPIPLHPPFARGFSLTWVLGTDPYYLGLTCTLPFRCRRSPGLLLLSSTHPPFTLPPSLFSLATLSSQRSSRKLAGSCPIAPYSDVKAEPLLLLSHPLATRSRTVFYFFSCRRGRHISYLLSKLRLPLIAGSTTLFYFFTLPHLCPQTLSLPFCGKTKQNHF
jgi:hypothetical protein